MADACFATGRPMDGFSLEHHARALAAGGHFPLPWRRLTRFRARPDWIGSFRVPAALVLRLANSVRSTAYGNGLAASCETWASDNYFRFFPPKKGIVADCLIHAAN